MSNVEESYRAHVVYMNLGTGEEGHVYSDRPYSSKAPATRSLNKLKKRKTYHYRRTMRNPNYNFGNGEPYMIEDPSDTRTEDELLPYFDGYVERATEWERA